MVYVLLTIHLGYEQLSNCAKSSASQINQCQKNSEMKMGDLTNLSPNSQTSASYYTQFCRYGPTV